MAKTYNSYAGQPVSVLEVVPFPFDGSGVVSGYSIGVYVRGDGFPPKVPHAYVYSTKYDFVKDESYVTYVFPFGKLNLGKFYALRFRNKMCKLAKEYNAKQR